MIKLSKKSSLPPRYLKLLFVSNSKMNSEKHFALKDQLTLSKLQTYFSSGIVPPNMHQNQLKKYQDLFSTYDGNTKDFLEFHLRQDYYRV